MQERIDAINNTLQENLIGQRVVKSFVRADFEIDKFQKSNDALTNAFIRAVSIVILNMPVMMLVMNGATLAIIWLGGHMVFAGTLGAGAADQLPQLRVPDPDQRHDDLDGLHHGRARPGQRPARAGGAGDRGGHRRQAARRQRDGRRAAPQVTAGKVEFRDVSFKYSLTGTGEEVLSGISFTAEPGEVVGHRRRHRLRQIHPGQPDPPALRRHGGRGAGGRPSTCATTRSRRCASGIGVVLQKNTLFSGTIRENLLWGRTDATPGGDRGRLPGCPGARFHHVLPRRATTPSWARAG